MTAKMQNPDLPKDSLIRRKAVTINDIARTAGVSIATVSRVLNRPDSVRETTRQKVSDAISLLGYEAAPGISSGSSGPASGRTGPAAVPGTSVPKDKKREGLIVINIPSLSNPFYDEIIKGVRTSVIRHGYTLFINESHINQETIGTLLPILEKYQVAGLITMNRIEEGICRQLREVTQVVQCAEYNEKASLPYVGIDNAASARIAVEHLIAGGRKRIAFLNGPLSYVYAEQRLKGYLAALEEAQLTPVPAYTVSLPDIDPDLALSAMLQLLSLPEPPDAVFSASDAFCAPVLRACRLRGFSIPEDIALVGFDNMDISRHLCPSITTVSQPKMQMGFLAAEMLFERLFNPSAPVRSTLLDTELIVRESSGSPGV